MTEKSILAKTIQELKSVEDLKKECIAVLYIAFWQYQHLSRFDRGIEK